MHFDKIFSIQDNWLLYVFIAVIVAAGVAYFLWDRYQTLQALQSKRPGDVFAGLCQAHKLGKPERLLLQQALPNVRRPEEVARVFVDPSILQKLAASANPNAAAYKALSQRLFGTR